MGKPDTEWNALPHGELEPLAENVWWVEGRLPNMKLKRTMVVARLPGGDLALHSAIALDDPGMAALEALGRPAWMVVPNGWHRLDAARYKARYPEMRVVCPAGSKKRVEQMVPVDGTYDDPGGLDPDGATITFEGFGDKKKMEGCMLVQSADGVTCVFGDSLFNLPHQKGGFWFLYGRLMGSTGGPRVTLLGRLMLLIGGATKAYKGWLNRTADRGDVVRLVPGHGHVITEDASAVLRQVASRL